MARAVLGAEQIHGECPSHEPAALKAFCGRAWMYPTQRSSDDATGCGICRLAPGSVPGLPGLGGGRPSGSGASLAKRSTQPRLFRGSRLLLPEPTRRLDAESYWREATKTRFLPRGLERRQDGRGTRRRLFPISRQPANSVRAAEGEKSAKHPGQTGALARAGDKRWGGRPPGHTGPLQERWQPRPAHCWGPRAPTTEACFFLSLKEEFMSEERGVCVVWRALAKRKSLLLKIARHTFRLALCPGGGEDAGGGALRFRSGSLLGLAEPLRFLLLFTLLENGSWLLQCLFLF